MFKIGDVVKFVGWKGDDRYKVINVFPTGEMILRRNELTVKEMNFKVNCSTDLKLDKIYYRKLKIEKICTKLGIK